MSRNSDLQRRKMKTMLILWVIVALISALFFARHWE